MRNTNNEDDGCGGRGSKAKLVLDLLLLTVATDAWVGDSDPIELIVEVGTDCCCCGCWAAATATDRNAFNAAVITSLIQKQ